MLNEEEPPKGEVSDLHSAFCIHHSAFPAHPLVRRGTPVLFRPPRVWLRKFWAPPPKGRLDFFWPPVGTKRLPRVLPAGLFMPCFSCLKFALSCFCGGAVWLAAGWSG